jgi:hypothetical protein
VPIYSRGGHQGNILIDCRIPTSILNSEPTTKTISPINFFRRPKPPKREQLLRLDREDERRGLYQGPVGPDYNMRQAYTHFWDSGYTTHDFDGDSERPGFKTRLIPIGMERRMRSLCASGSALSTLRVRTSSSTSESDSGGSSHQHGSTACHLQQPQA